jgi:hypothetical protein
MHRVCRGYPWMKTFVVTDQNYEWLEIPEASVLTARRYLSEPEGGNSAAVQVLNLCRTSRYQGRGYYVSLLAEARGQRPVADVKANENLRSDAFQQTLAAELQDLVHETLHHNDSERFELNVYFGRHPAYPALAEQLFARVRAPLLRVMFARTEGNWRLDALHAVGPCRYSASRPRTAARCGPLVHFRQAGTQAARRRCGPAATGHPLGSRTKRTSRPTRKRCSDS